MIFEYRVTSDGKWSFPFANNHTEDLCGLSPESIRDDANLFHEMVNEEDLAQFLKTREISQKALSLWTHEFRVEHPFKGTRWLRCHASPRKNLDLSISWFGFLIDFTFEKAAEEKLINRTKLLSVEGEINKMIIHSRSREEVFQKACDIAISAGDFKLAWIGLHEPTSMSLYPVAKSGPEISYLENVSLISVADVPLGKGPSGIAFRENKTVINNDMQKNPLYSPWIEMAKKHGLHSSIALPLRIKGRVIGTFNIYGPTKNFFFEEEINLLEQISRDISFAVEMLDTRRELEDTQLNFQNVFAEAPMGILLSDPVSGEIFQINDRYLELLGYTKDNFHFKTWMEFTHPDDLSGDLKQSSLLFRQRINKLKRTKRYIKQDGEIVWVDVYAVPFHHGESGRQLNLVMAQDVSERIKYENELQSSILLKDEFIAIASHELKTPATSLKLQLQLLQREMKQTTDFEDLKSKCEKRVGNSIYLLNHLNELINRLLDVSIFKSGSFKITLQLTDLSNLLKEELLKFQTSFEVRKCKIRIQNHDHIVGWFDEDKIKQVFGTLMDNVLRYAPGCDVSINLLQKNEEVLFSIKDTGRGIDPDKIAKIFNEFERLDADRNLGGFGLGLYVAKRFVEAHGGSIVIKSKIGEGTEVTVKLPLKESSRLESDGNII